MLSRSSLPVDGGGGASPVSVFDRLGVLNTGVVSRLGKLFSAPGWRGFAIRRSNASPVTQRNALVSSRWPVANALGSDGHHHPCHPVTPTRGHPSPGGECHGSSTAGPRRRV